MVTGTAVLLALTAMMTHDRFQYWLAIISGLIAIAGWVKHERRTRNAKNVSEPPRTDSSSES
jgi:hypothetical protein